MNKSFLKIIKPLTVFLFTPLILFSPNNSFAETISAPTVDQIIQTDESIEPIQIITPALTPVLTPDPATTILQPTAQPPTLEIIPYSEPPTTTELPITTPDIDTIDSTDIPQPTPVLDQSLQLAVNGITNYKDTIKSFKSILPEADPLTGALTIKYPIEVPPGRNGLQPNLNLVYNSQNAENINFFGFGWTIDIPYIERINKIGLNKMYQQNYFTSSLDGELIPVTLSDGSHGSYIAKIENGSFLQYSFNSDDSWTVTDKIGLKHTFDYIVVSDSKKFRWCLTEIRDTNDNYIKYTYNSLENIQSILYTGNGTTDGIYKITFNTEQRPDVGATYNTGIPITNNNRVRQISIRINQESTPSRIYSFSYTSGENGHRSLLESITLSAQENGITITMPPEKFEYENNTGKTNFSAGESTWTNKASFDFPVDLFNEEDNTSDNGVRFADVDGDGFIDILHAKRRRTSDGPSINNVYINNANNTGWTLDSNYEIPDDFVNWDGEDGGARIADVNGDGLPDIVHSCHLESCGRVHINKGDGTGWEEDGSYEIPVVFEYEDANENILDNGVRLADINGDGLTDFIWSREGEEALYLNNGYGWDEYDTPIPVRFDEIGTKIADVNGDGLPDFVRYLADNDYFEVFINNGFRYDDAGADLWVLNNNYQVPNVSDNVDTETTWNENTRLEDINGDGLIDVIYDGYHELVENGNHNKTTVFLNLKNNRGWAQTPSFNIDTGDTSIKFTQNYSKGSEFVDVDADGISDFIITTDDYRKVYISNFRPSDIIGKITTSKGGITYVKYSPSTAYKDINGNPLNTKFPFVYQTVAQLFINDGTGSNYFTDSKYYEYSGASYYYSSPTDRRFAGFNKIAVSNSSTITKTDYYLQGDATTDTLHGEFDDDPSKIGKIYYSTLTGGDGKIYTETINLWLTEFLDNGSSFVKLAKTVSKNNEIDSTSKHKMQTYFYDSSDGNLRQTVDYGEVIATTSGNLSQDIGADKYTVNIVYAKSTNGKITGLPSQEYILDYSGTMVSDTKYYYDNLSLGSISNGNLTKIDRLKSGSQYISLSKTYNSYGLVTSETDAMNNKTTYVYDLNNLWPSSIINALNQTEYYSYDLSSGKITQKINAQNLIYQTSYDAFDRITLELQPDITNPSQLVQRTTSYTYYDQTIPSYIVKMDLTESSKGLITYTYYDGLGRVIQERKLHDDSNNFSVKDYIYDNEACLQQESLPYLAFGPSRSKPTTTYSLYTSYSRDRVLRTGGVYDNVGSLTNAYTAWGQSITDAENNTKSFFYDAFGNLVKVIEPEGGAITKYEYNSLNKLSKITDSKGNIRNFTYDNLGELSTSEDLHTPGDTTFGIYSYTYDNAGNIKTQTDPKGQVTTYTYDALNRIRTEDSSTKTGIEVTYVYDSCTYGIGKLCSVTTNDTIKTFSYTPIQNLETEIIKIDGVSYPTKYSYDRQKKIVSITYPDNTIVSYTYNDAGFLKTVKQNGNNVITYISYAPTGQPTKIEYANGTATENILDPKMLYRLTNKNTKKGTTIIQNISYIYDKVGNIKKITDTSSPQISKVADLTYDKAYRLKQAVITNTGNNSNYTQTYSYDLIGNITNRSDKGNYLYEGNLGTSFASPYALTSIGTVKYNYDKNGNLISDGQRTFEWDYKNRLTKVTNSAGATTYTYDDEMERIKQSNPTGTIKYINKYYEIENSSLTKHIFAGNENVASIVKSVDTTPPAKIMNLKASDITNNTLTLTWTAPGNDGSTGTASSYDIRYSTTIITEATWSTAKKITDSIPIPLIFGTSQSLKVTGLSKNTTYYFAIKTSDGAPNISDISNVISAKTLLSLNYILSFDGKDDVVSTRLKIDQTSASTGYTMEAWVYPTSTSTGKHQVISTDNGGYDWSILRNGDKWYVNTGTSSYNTGFTVDLNKWQHVVATFTPGSTLKSSSRVVKFYKNGVEKSITEIGFDSSTGNILIGRNSSSSTELFAGKIDDVRIWAKVQTKEDINTNMKIQLTGLETGLFAYYKFDESSGQSIYNAISANPLINPIIAVRGLTSQVETSDPVWGKEELAF